MALQSSGQISLNDLHVEAGGVSGTECSLNDTDIRSIISVGDQSQDHKISLYYGASSEQSFTISSNQTGLDLATYLTNEGWNGSATAIVTINSGVWIISNSVSTAAITISNAFNNKLTLINNGIIMGRGGNGGYRGSPAAQSGGAGVSNSATGVVFTNNSGAYLAGGGGGGAASANDSSGNDMGSGGGGAGGGMGGPYPSSYPNGPSGGGINGYGATGSRSNPNGGYGGGAGGGGGAADTNDGGDGGGGGRRVDSVSNAIGGTNVGRYNYGTRGAFGGLGGTAPSTYDIPGGNGGGLNSAGSNYSQQGAAKSTDASGAGGGGYGAAGGNGRLQTGGSGGAAWAGTDWASVTNNGTIWGST